MGKFSDRIMNKPIDDMARFNVEKENARLQGKYPMTIEMLKEEIMKVSPDLQTYYGDVPMVATKYFMFAIADGIGDDYDKIFKYYIDEVKPFVFKTLPS